MDTVYVPKNAVYLELGGNGWFYSLNYEREIFKKDVTTISSGIGFSTAFSFNGSVVGLMFPVNLSTFQFGRKKSRLEIEISSSLFVNFYPSPRTREGRKYYFEHLDEVQGGAPYAPPVKIFLTPGIGYRYIAKNGFLFRATATSFIFRSRDGNIITYRAAPWLGISFGYFF